MKILVSACLLGENCKYNGKNNYSERVAKYLEGHEVIPVCPEVLGGLPTPRDPSEIVSGEVINCKGVNVDRQFREGAEEALRIAKENGIDKEYVEMYLSGDIPVLCDAMTAALGKIDIEVADLKPKEIMEDWVEYLRGQCMENELLAFNVRKKGKSLKGCIAALLMWSFKNQQPIDKGIIKAAGISAGKVTLGIPGMAKAKQIITDYYMGK